MMGDGLPSNGLPFSCRERAAATCQKATDLVREVVSYSGLLDGSHCRTLFMSNTAELSN
jgi:hypothetical protein